jgi:hypothetical protein
MALGMCVNIRHACIRGNSVVSPVLPSDLRTSMNARSKGSGVLKDLNAMLSFFLESLSFKTLATTCPSSLLYMPENLDPLNHR